VQKKFQKLDETEMETKKKKKKSKSRHNKNTAGNSLLQSELYQAGVNASLNERVSKSKEVGSPSATIVRTQNFAATNEVCTLVDKSVMSKRKSKTKKLRETENHELECEGMQNMKYRNKDSETSTKHRKENKWKGIASEDTTHTEETLMMDTALQEHFGHDSKKKRKKRKALEAENSA
jgi:hypothetical protein